MRKALVIGIDYYHHLGPLTGCVADAERVFRLLERHADNAVNFVQPRLATAIDRGSAIERSTLREAVEELFRDDSEVALFYFAGHGFIDTPGGYVCASDCRDGHDGLALAEIMTYANRSPARNKVILLDSCYGGAVGDHPLQGNVAELSEGMTILTASTRGQYAEEANGAGVFTNLLVDALRGAAANLLGDITPGSVYAHIDQSLGTWSQRPVFKTNVKRFVSLRRVAPPVPLEDLRRITEFFPTPNFQYPLDPSYEPASSAPDPAHTNIFSILQKYNRVNLLVPVGVSHMYYAAMESMVVRLTALGEHYRRLVAGGLI
jgi:hypothetical protein